MKRTENLKYTQDDNAFYMTLRKRVNKYFSDSGITKYANTAMYTKTVTQLLLFLGTYTLILSNKFFGWTLLALQIIFHFSMFLISVGIAHEGSHNAYSSKKWINKTAVFVFDLIGINSHFWVQNHIHSHHNVPNVPLYDSAIESFGAIRLHPKTKANWLSKYQHLYMFIVYGFAPLFLVFVLDPLSFLQRVIGYEKNNAHHWGQILFMYVSKVIVLGYTLIIPIIVIDVPAWQIVAGFLAGHFISGVALGIVFQTTHLSDFSQFPEPDKNGYLNHSYAAHIMKTTASFSVSNPVVTWISGGLNLHTIHHLFPNICQIHLPKLVPILRETAKEFGIPYKEYGFWGAIASHLRLLKKLGNAPSYIPEDQQSIYSAN